MVASPLGLQGRTKLKEEHWIENRGPALLNRHRLFGPLSPKPQVLVGNSERTKYNKRREFSTLYI
jgi:hypothetical protein